MKKLLISMQFHESYGEISSESIKTSMLSLLNKKVRKVKGNQGFHKHFQKRSYYSGTISQYEQITAPNLHYLIFGYSTCHYAISLGKKMKNQLE